MLFENVFWYEYLNSSFCFEKGQVRALNIQVLGGGMQSDECTHMKYIKRGICR